MSWFEVIGQASKSLKLPREGQKAREIGIFGLESGSRPFFTACLQASGLFPPPALVLLPSPESAEDFYEDFLPFCPPELRDRVRLFPPSEISAFSRESSPQRLQVLKMLSEAERLTIITSLGALLEKCPDPENFKLRRLVLKKGGEIDPDKLLDDLIDLGYQRVPMVEKPGEAARRGGIIDLFPLAGESAPRPYRLELWGDRIEQIRELDLDSQRSIGDLPQIVILTAREEKGEAWLTGYLSPDTSVLFYEKLALEQAARREEQPQAFAEISDELKRLGRHWHFGDAEALPKLPVLEVKSHPAPEFPFKLEDFLKTLRGLEKEKYRILLLSQQSARLKEILTLAELDFCENAPAPGRIALLSGAYSRGFVMPEWKLAVFTDREILGGFRRKRYFRDFVPPSRYQLEDLTPGELVVHQNYGIGKFAGIKPLEVEGKIRDFCILEYQRGDLLYLPVEQMDLIAKYVGLSDKPGSLSRLGGVRWQKTRRQVEEEVEKLAQKLLELYAGRKLSPGHRFSPDTVWQQELEASFPYQETPDQQMAILEVKRDMEAVKPMERLVCGDAGYGKTEVALRAVFKAVMEGKQAAVLVPTTILAQQHYHNFQQRMGAFPVKIEMLSRFRTDKEQRQIVEELARGGIDVIIGTHRLLQSDIKFKDLGLLVIDEEQRFGVLQKEKIKEMKSGVDILVLTATPIPRTLYLSMTGVMDTSRIENPPYERLPIKTYLLPAKPEVIREGVLRELKRGGQVFFLNPRIKGMDKIARELKALIPEARLATAHGQMPEELLESIMLDFIDKKYDILLSTTIVENGIDIPNVNTIFINHADQFGLSQLYQLRGRVGRGHHQGYAFLLYPEQKVLSSIAEERLQTLREFSELGGAFQLALRDMEIRGAGNMLGREQHGFIANVGFNLYSELLRKGISRAKAEPAVEGRLSPRIDLPLKAFLADDYIPYFREKLTLYKRMSDITEFSEIEDMRKELRDKFGPLPPEAESLLELLGLKIWALKAQCPLIKTQGEKLFLTFPDFPQFSPTDLKRLEKEIGLTVKFSPYQFEVSGGEESALDTARKFLKTIVSFLPN